MQTRRDPPPSTGAARVYAVGAKLPAAADIYIDNGSGCELGGRDVLYDHHDSIGELPPADFANAPLVVE